jgi:hypothetical protein
VRAKQGAPPPPNIGEETLTDSTGVFGIPGQLGLQGSVFDAGAQDKQGSAQRTGDHRPPGCKQRRRGQLEDDRPGIRRMLTKRNAPRNSGLSRVSADSRAADRILSRGPFQPLSGSVAFSRQPPGTQASSPPFTVLRGARRQDGTPCHRHQPVSSPPSRGDNLVNHPGRTRPARVGARPAPSVCERAGSPPCIAAATVAQADAGGGEEGWTFVPS